MKSALLPLTFSLAASSNSALTALPTPAASHTFPDPTTTSYNPSCYAHTAFRVSHSQGPANYLGEGGFEGDGALYRREQCHTKTKKETVDETVTVLATRGPIPSGQKTSQLIPFSTMAPSLHGRGGLWETEVSNNEEAKSYDWSLNEADADDEDDDQEYGTVPTLQKRKGGGRGGGKGSKHKAGGKKNKGCTTTTTVFDTKYHTATVLMEPEAGFQTSTVPGEVTFHDRRLGPVTTMVSHGERRAVPPLYGWY